MPDCARHSSVHLYALCWNEERLLPFFFHHYDPFVTRHFIFDHDSTDRSRQILRAHPQVALGNFEGRGDSYISSARDFYNHAWKQSRGFGAVAGRGCGPLPIDPEIIISEQARLRASVAWLGRSYSRACEKLTRSELVNEIRWIRSEFERRGNTEVNLRTLQQQLAFWKRLEALAVAS